MIFAAPLALLGLLALPALVLLLRLNPPPPRRQRFPPLALLRDLPAPPRTPNRIPLWLLILRLAAAALVCIGLAGPTLHPPPALPGAGPVLLVIDNGWAAAADWPARRAAALRLIAAAARGNRPVDLLATAPDASGAAPRLTGPLTAPAAAEAIEALQPQPWPPDRAAAITALATAPTASRIYIADGLTDGPSFPRFLKTLAPDQIIADDTAPPLLLSIRLTSARGLSIRGANLPAGSVLSAHTAGGGVIARTGFSRTGEALIALPPQLANQITSVTLDGPPSAAKTLLLDAASRTIITGLAAGAGNADNPYLGALYFLRRALPPNAQLIQGDLPSLINAHPGLIILADLPLDAAQAAAAHRYVAAGGVLVRFAGPVTAAAPDELAADPLLPGDRRLGGALTWTAPQPLAAFPRTSPFLGLPPDSAVRTTRQILADPTRLDPATVWASLQDGTPLVLGASSGRGVLVSVLTTANTDWSTLALSGLYPAMLARLTTLATGAASKPAPLPLQAQLTAYGGLVAPANPANLSASLATVTVSPTQPAGLYGDGPSLALNLGDHVPFPVAAPLPHPTPLIGPPPPANLGAGCVAAALLLLAADLLVSLRRRGAITWRRSAVLALLLSPGLGHAQSAALQTSLGYIRTNDSATDQTSADGLGYLSAEVSIHTSTALGVPTALDPATDSLNLYPLIYWPLRPAGASPTQAACTALNDYMRHGGLLIIDTQGSDVTGTGSGAGLAPGAGAALSRATACLDLPPLQPLTGTDVLAHCFYILHDFPGRFTGAPTFIAAPAARDDDGVSPIIIGANDWAGAWARDDTGTPEQLPIPGGEDQRLLADRFGTNLVIYALTGSYKADQSNLTTLLGRLGP